MPGVARLNDRTSGVCSVHGPVGGTITEASNNTFCNGRGVARLGDTVTADCGHTGNISSSSEDEFCNGRGVARLGDSVSGTYNATIVTASGDTNSN